MTGLPAESGVGVRKELGRQFRPGEEARRA